MGVDARFRGHDGADGHDGGTKRQPVYHFIIHVIRGFIELKEVFSLALLYSTP